MIDLALLKTKQLSVTYPNGKRALRSFDFQINSGEIVLLAGQTGSGKSTLAQRLLNVIPNQIQAACEGEISLFGERCDDMPTHELARQVQLILQNPEAMLFALTVEGNIHFGLENHCVPPREIEEKTDHVLGLMQIASLRKRSPLELSGGEQQAAAIASVLVLNPSLFILDEPLTYLDAAGKKRLLRHLEALKKERKSILILEHRLDLAKSIADRIVVLKEGEKVLDQPAPLVSEKELIQSLGLRGTSFFNFSRCEKNKTEAKPALEFKQVTFSYALEKKALPPALKKVSFQIEQQDCVALLGPNGSGKSTVATCAIGLDKPQSGSIYLNGVDLKTLSPIARAQQIGLMFQKPEVQLFCRSVREELLFGGKNLHIPTQELEQRVEKEAAGLGLTHLMARHPATLSRGEMRRVALASLLIMRPSILILDEPTIGQDYANLEKIGERLKEQNECGTTLIVITHDTDFAQQLAQKTIYLDQGEVKEDVALRAL